MIRLALTLYLMAAPSLAGVGVVIALVAGYSAVLPFLIAAAIGSILGVPVAYLLAKQLYS